MSAFASLTEREAHENAAAIEGVVASYEGAQGRVYCALSNAREARAWFNFQRDGGLLRLGTERIDTPNDAA